MMLPLLIVLALASDPAPPAPSKPVALVVTCSGPATWSDGKTTRPLKTYQRLRPGETVAVGPGGGATLYYSEDGHKEVLQPDARVVVGPQRGATAGKVVVLESRLKVENQNALREAIGAGKIGGSVVREDVPPVPIIAPLDTTIIATDRPTLRWPAVKEATGYRVTLRTPTKLVWTREVAGAELKYPADGLALQRAKKYHWTVTALFANDNEKPHLKERTFIVGPEDLVKKAEAWNECAQSADPDDLVLAAIGYERLGLLDELHPLYARITRTLTNDAGLWAARAYYAEQAGLMQDGEDAWKKAFALGWTADSD